MSSISHHQARRNETSLQPAIRRSKRFGLVAAAAIGAMFLVLAVKAQVAPHRGWIDLWPGYETHR